MHVRVSVVAGVVAAGLLLTTDVRVRGQAPAQGAVEQRPAGPPLRVGVDAVRIDAVVTDRDGRIVPNLTADDFEVRQDGKLQRISFVDYIPIRTGPAEPSSTPSGGAPAATASSTAPSASIAAPGRAPATRAPVKPEPVKREDVQRTLAIVVDDLGLSFESFHGMQRALHTFVDREIRPGDLVAIVRTSGAGGGLQPFTADPRVLHSVIDGLGWNGRSRNAVEPYEAINQWTTFGGGGPAPAPSEPQPGSPSGPNQLRASASAFGASALDPNDFSALNQLRASSSAAGSLGALNLVVRGARELPGRKAVILVTEGFSMQDADGLDSRVRDALDRVVDQALRAGVVIYSLDPRGLQTAGLLASDNLKSKPAGELMDAAVRAKGSDRIEFNRDTQEGMAYLAEQTGGFSVLNTNDLPWGLGRIAGDVRDYYIIGYVPAEGTFARPGEKPELHRISIRTKRPDLRVKTRKEFLGVSDPPPGTGPLTPAQQLVHAATSPFAATGIALRATTLPGFSEEKGLFVRALLHIDARPLTFVDSEGGRKTASVDVLGMVFDREGTEVAHLSTGFALALTKEGAEAALGDGIAYVLRIPISRAGGYQVRFAVRDQRSGLVGSAGEFVDVDDIPGGAFALSGIVLRPDERGGAGGSKVPDDVTLSPAQALGVYRPGTRLAYAYEIYNAEAPVQAATSIWRGTDRILSVPPNTLVPPSGSGRRFTAAGGVKLGEKLPAGTYVLEIAAANPDPRRSGKSRVAVQRVAFDVR